jgi:hypothetical protein
MKIFFTRNRMPEQGPASEKARDDAWDAHKPAAVAPSAEPEKKQGWFGRTQQAVQAAMPQWVRENSGRINQIGLMAGTAVIMGSVWRGRTISKDIWNAQTKILEKNGFQGAALEKKVAELIDAKIMKKPALHRQRMIYLPTAITGLAIGGFIKDKETPEDRAAYKDMSLPQYMGMRLKQSLDPMHHSRQTAGVIGAASGVAAIVSAFSQPGGALISEAFVGATLISGFTGLTFINDPSAAKKALNVCWATRLPFVVSGTYETLATQPAFTTPLAAAEKLKPEYAQGVVKAMQEGVRIPRFGLGMGKIALAGRKLVTGGKAADAFTKSYLSLKLPYKRMDVSYPIGQWFNMGMATFGFLMAGSDEKKKAAASMVAPVTIDAAPIHKTETARIEQPAGPSPKVNAVQAEERLAAAPELSQATA